MSQPPVPVPSKAAIKALRGLVLGTTCSLALVAEDRRRRIQSARSAIQNAEKLRSARQYHAGGTAKVAAIEEDVWLEPNLARWDRRIASGEVVQSTEEVGRQGPERAPRGLSPERSRTKESSRSKALENSTHPVPVAKPHPPPAMSAISPFEAFDHAATSRLLFSRPPALLRIAAPSLNASLPPVEGSPACARAEAFLFHYHSTMLGANPELDHLEEVHKLLAEVLASKWLPASDRRLLAQAAVPICRACRSAGRMDLAQQTLRAVATAQVPIDEELYYAFLPLEIVESILATFDIGSGRAASAAQLDLASQCFLPTFDDPPRYSKPDVLALAKKLLEGAFALNHKDVLFRVFKAMLQGYKDFARSKLLLWYMENLSEHGLHKLVIDSFRRLMRSTLLDRTALRKLSDLTLDSVRDAHGYQVEHVLSELVHQWGGRGGLRPHLAHQLLLLHWQKTHDHASTMQLAELVLASAKSGATQAYVLELMVACSLEKGLADAAEEYASRHRALAVGLRAHCALRGAFALSEAREGNWAAVHREFTEMHKTMSSGSPRARKSWTSVAGRIYLPILVEFATTNRKVEEVESFVSTYLEDWEGPLTEQILTVMAEKYGSERDLKALLAWLEFCSKAGLGLSSRFRNVVLSIAFKNWGISYEHLHELYDELRRLSPESEDRVTRRIMAVAALKKPGKRAVTRVRALGGGINAAPWSGRCANKHDVLIAMRLAISNQRHLKAVTIYKQAIRAGMPPDDTCLRVATGAALRADPTLGAAMDLLKAAKAYGQDIGAATGQLVIYRLDHIDWAQGPEQVAAHVRRTIVGFQKNRLAVTDMAFNRAAFHLYKAGNFREAYACALRAAKTAQKPPGYNRYNFCILLWAFTRGGYPAGINLLVGTAAKGKVWDVDMSLQALRAALRYAEKTPGLSAREHVQEALLGGLELMKNTKAQIIDERQELQAEVIDIVREACQQHARETAPTATSDVPDDVGRFGGNADGEIIWDFSPDPEAKDVSGTWPMQPNAGEDSAASSEVPSADKAAAETVPHDLSGPGHPPRDDRRLYTLAVPENKASHLTPSKTAKGSARPAPPSPAWRKDCTTGKGSPQTLAPSAQDVDESDPFASLIAQAQHSKPKQQVSRDLPRAKWEDARTADAAG